MRVDGASGVGILRRLVLRYSASTIVALSVLVVIWVWGEVPIALAVLSPNNVSSFTLPLLVAEGQVPNPNAVYLLSMAVPLLLFLATQRLFRRGLVSASLL
jgi:ABC-type glycerol-3-phosphate transport system permease component